MKQRAGSPALRCVTVTAVLALLSGAGATGAPAQGISDPAVIVTPVALPLQPPATPFADPVFGTTMRRVSAASDTGGFETHTYSQLQAFSSDGVYVLLGGGDGYVVRRVADLTAVTGIDASDWNAPRWDPSQPHAIVHFDSNADTVVRLQRTDVESLQTTTLFTFPAVYQRVRVNQSFDELSRDGRWLGAMLSKADGSSVIVSLDVQAGVLGAELPIPTLYAGPCQPDPVWGVIEPDWLAASPLGRYLVVQWPRDGTERCSGLETFDIGTGTFAGRVYDGHQHGDLAVDADGVTEVFMTFELYHPSGNLSIGVRALPGTADASPPTYVQVLDWGNGEHISCRGPKGVCLVTAGTDSGNGWGPFEGELFLQRTGGTVLRLVHHRSSSCGYWVQPRASISRDGRYVVFASDWGRQLGCGDDGDGLGRGDAYIMDLWTSTPTPAATPTATAAAVGIGGRVSYYSNGQPVPGALVQLTGAISTTAQTDSTGAFEFASLGASDWQVQPHLSASTAGAVSALDAAYVLQAVVGTRAFDSVQRLACDVTGDGTLSALDATRILQRTVGLIPRLPAALACDSDMVFVPAPALAADQEIIPPHLSGGGCQPGAIAYRPLSAWSADQDFTAAMFGDCTGNWQPASATLRSQALPVLRPGRQRTSRSGATWVPLYIESNEPVYAFEVVLHFASERTRAVAVRRPRPTPGGHVAFNAAAPNGVKIAFASPFPLVADGHPVLLVRIDGDR